MKILALCSLVLLHYTAVDAMIEISLRRGKSGREFMYEKGTTEEHLQFYKPPKPVNNDSVALYKYLDTDFYAVIHVGSPGQEFKVAIDTAWGNSWIPSKLCPITCASCWLRNKYDSTRSSTYQSDGTKFSIANLEGFLSTDKINLGHLDVENQTFAEVTKIPFVSIFTKIDGILGFGLQALASYGVPPIFYNIYKQGLVKQPIFSIYVSRDYTTEHAGVLFLGGNDPKHYFNDTLFYVPVTRAMYWQFKMDRVVIKSGLKYIQFCKNGCEAVIDSSTSVIIGPAEEIKTINNILGATTLVMNRYEVKCSLIPKLPKINFMIGNKNFTLHGRTLVQKLSIRGFTTCLSVFVPSTLPKPMDNLWFLGGSFLQEAYVIFDVGTNTMGFAKTR